jgi:hypothetical protein
LSLLGGVGTLVALFLPWLSLTLVSEQICSAQACISTPDSASVRGWDLFFTHPFLLLLLLPLLVLSAAVNLSSSVLRLLALQWNPVWFWGGALVATSAALAAFVPWLLTYPLPGAQAVVDGHITASQYGLGLYAALVAGFVSLLGTLLLLDQRRSVLPPSPASMDEHGSRTTPDQRFGRGLAIGSLMLLLVFASFVIASTEVVSPRMTDEALHGWEVLFFLALPPFVAGLAVTSLLHAFRRHQGVWLVLLCLAFTHASLGWAYALSGSLGPPGVLDAGNNAEMALALLWGGYLVSSTLCGVYAVVVLLTTRPVPTPSAV